MNVNGAGAGSATTQEAQYNLTFNHVLAAGAGNRVVKVGVSGYQASLGANADTTVTYGGVAMTQVTKLQTTNRYVALFVLKEASLPANGVTAVAVTYGTVWAPGNNMQQAASCVCYDTVDQGTTTRNATTGSGSGTAAALTVTTSVDDWAIGAANWDDNAVSAGAGTTVDATGLAAADISSCVAHRPYNAATTTVNLTIDNVTWSMAGCALIPLAGGSAALTGTAAAGITEADIVTGGKTIILTLTGDTFIAA